MMIRGTAYAEIDEWAEAIARFEEARSIAGEDPVVLFNLAVCHLRSDRPQQAIELLDRVDEDAPRKVQARIEYLRGKLALEVGDLQAEADAYRRAMELDPDEPAYPFALTQLLPRMGAAAEAEVGPLLERALGSWPANARLLADQVVWRLGRPDSASWQLAIETLTQLFGDDPRGLAQIERARSEMRSEPDRSPPSARRAVNLLRPGKRFQADWAALESRLALLPIRRPAASELLETREPTRATITVERSAGLLELALADDERPLSVVASIDAFDPDDSDASGAAPKRAADLTLLTDRRLLLLDRTAGSFRLLAEISDGGGGQRVLAADLDADGGMERIVLSEQGVTIFRRSASGDPSPENWTRDDPLPTPPLRDGILVDFEVDGDLDLLLITDTGRPLLVLNRGEAGLGTPETLGLPIERADRILARDLDGDVDPDLLVADGDRIIVLNNRRQGDYEVLEGQGELLLALEVEAEPGGGVDDWTTGDFDGDGKVDLVAVAQGRLHFFRGRGAGGFEVDPIRTSAAATLPDAETPVLSIIAADLDLDGEPELVVERQGEGSRSVEVLDGDSLAILARSGGLAPGPAGLLVTDLDRDRDHDVLLTTSSGLETLSTSGTDGQGWIELVLRGLAAKVPLDGRGARVDVWFGLDRKSFEPELPEVLIGLGGRSPALVEVTWPNGITEFVFDPEPRATHRVEQELRIEGSCPFLYASDGEGLRFVTDVLSLAPLGMLAAADRYVPADPEEYLRLPDWVAPDRETGDLELAITEELREVAYLDQVELVVVDAPAGIRVFNGERWIEGKVEGLDLRLLGPLQALTSAVTAEGDDVLEIIAQEDHRYFRHSAAGRRYQGAGRPRSLELELSTELAATGRVALVMNGWLHWGNTSTNVARSQDPEGRPIFPFLEVPTANGTWRRVELDVGLPAGKTKPIVVALGDAVDPNDPRFRLTTDFEVYWDRIAAAESRPLATTAHREQRLAPANAHLSFGGFSRWYRPAAQGPYLFDYRDRRPYPWRPTETGERVLAWAEHEGFYSPYGDATPVVATLDDRLAVFGSGEQLSLRFDLDQLAPPPAGWRRTFFLHLEGWEKDGDPNVACSETVGPLPSRGAVYACERAEATVATRNGASGGRWVDRDRLLRRVRSATGGR